MHITSSIDAGEPTKRCYASSELRTVFLGRQGQELQADGQQEVGEEVDAREGGRRDLQAFGRSGRPQLAEDP